MCKENGTKSPTCPMLSTCTHPPMQWKIWWKNWNILATIRTITGKLSATILHSVRRTWFCTPWEVSVPLRRQRALRNVNSQSHSSWSNCHATSRSEILVRKSCRLLTVPNVLRNARLVNVNVIVVGSRCNNTHEIRSVANLARRTIPRNCGHIAVGRCANDKEQCHRCAGQKIGSFGRYSRFVAVGIWVNFFF